MRTADSVMFDFFATLWTAACQAFCLRDSPGNTEWVVMPSLQGIFLTQGLNPRFMSPTLADGSFTASHLEALMET